MGGTGISWTMCKSSHYLTIQFLQARCPSCHPTNSAKAENLSKKRYKWFAYGAADATVKSCPIYITEWFNLSGSKPLNKS